MKSQLFLISLRFLTFAAMNNATAETETENATKPLSRPPSMPARGHRRAIHPPGARRHLDDHGQLPRGEDLQFRDEFIDTVIKPFNARLTKPLVPTMRSLHSDGDTVIALFDGEALALDGKPYRNTYAWFMEMKDGKIVKATAFSTRLPSTSFGSACHRGRSNRSPFSRKARDVRLEHSRAWRHAKPQKRRAGGLCR